MIVLDPYGRPRIANEGARPNPADGLFHFHGDHSLQINPISNRLELVNDPDAPQDGLLPCERQALGMLYLETKNDYLAADPTWTASLGSGGLIWLMKGAISAGDLNGGIHNYDYTKAPLVSNGQQVTFVFTGGGINRVNHNNLNGPTYFWQYTPVFTKDGLAFFELAVMFSPTHTYCSKRDTSNFECNQVQANYWVDWGNNPMNTASVAYPQIHRLNGSTLGLNDMPMALIELMILKPATPLPYETFNGHQITSNFWRYYDPTEPFLESLNPIEHFIPTPSNTMQSTITGKRYTPAGSITRIYV